MTITVCEIGNAWYFTTADDMQAKENEYVTITHYPDCDWPDFFPIPIEGPFRTRADAEAAVGVWQAIEAREGG